MDHFSEGQNNLQWIENNLKVHQKYNNYLPLATHNYNLSKEDYDKIDERWLSYWIQIMVSQNVSLISCAWYVSKMLRLRNEADAQQALRVFYNLFYLCMRRLYKRIQHK